MSVQEMRDTYTLLLLAVWAVRSPLIGTLCYCAGDPAVGNGAVGG
jgi:hypothetical protein